MSADLHFASLPLGAVRPEGWLWSVLKRQAEGLTGLMEEIKPRPGFRVNPVNRDSVWRGGNRGRYNPAATAADRAPYYVRGLVATAFVLNDEKLQHQAGDWLGYWFASQEPDGNIKAKGVSDYEWWPRIIIADAVRLYYEGSKDMRAIAFLSRFFSFQSKNLEKHPLSRMKRYYSEWHNRASFRGGDNMDIVTWLYRLNEDPALYTLTRLINKQTFPWEKFLMERDLIQTDALNLAHGLRVPALNYILRPDDELYRIAREAFRKMMIQHGQVSGSLSGDKKTAGRRPTAGTELCTVVELLRTMLLNIGVLGTPYFADYAERLAYNALAAAIAPDFRSHQSFSQANQVYCTSGNHGFEANRTDFSYRYGDALTFGAPAGSSCCFYNFHLGWPMFVSAMWMKYRKDGLVAVLYGPCRVETEIKGVKVCIHEKTSYPFTEEIILDIKCEQPVDFALLLRIPEWCREGQARLAEDIYRGYGGTFIPIRRTWQKREVITLDFPMEARIRPWYRDALMVKRGPLIFALNPAEEWVSMENSGEFPSYEVVPAAEEPVKKRGWKFKAPPAWNYGLEKNSSCKVSAPDVYSPEDNSINAIDFPGYFPWSPETVPVKIRLPGIRVTNWERSSGIRAGGLNAGPLPDKPAADKNTTELTLIPYGAARLRISTFPII